MMVAVPGCAKKSTAGTASEPMDAAAFAPPPAGDDLAAYEQQLAVAEADLRRLGVSPAPAGGADAPAAGADAEAAADDDLAEAEAPAPTQPTSDEPRQRRDEARGRFSERKQKDRCTSICDVAKTVCTLEGKICGLASTHGDDPRYQNACARATDDCEVGEEACRACEA